MEHGIGNQLRSEEFGGVREADQAVHGEDQAEGAAADGDGSGVVRDGEGVLPGFGFGHAATPGDRGGLDWLLAVSLPQPSWQDEAVRFRSVCVASPTAEQRFFLAQADGVI